MKQRFRKILALTLSLCLLSTITLSALASGAMGDALTNHDTVLHEATQLSKNVFWSSVYSDLRTENFISYTPNTAVTPIVTYGGVITDRSTISNTAAALERQGYRVVAGMNGDFFNVNNGLPIGLLVSHGQIKSSDGGYYAIGFHADGTTVMGRPALSIQADLGFKGADGVTAVVRNVTGVNKARVATGGMYIYTYDFNARHTTGNTQPGVDVLCNITGGSLSVGGTLELQAVQVIEATGATPIASNQIVLSANSQSNAYILDALRKVTPGSTLRVSVSASDAKWNGIQYAVGALYSLVENGALVSGLSNDSNPRTAIGLKPDGTVIFYVIDGRRSGYSVGASMKQVAQRLLELGCTSALCLDGGGSTTLTVTQPTATKAKTINRPSDGAERAVTNQVFLVATNQPSGVLGHFYVAAEQDYVLAGSSVQISAAAVDTNYIPMSSQNYTLSATAGTINGSTLLTPKEGGDITVTASASDSSGSTVVHAIAYPEGVSISSGSSTTMLTSLTVAPGSTTALTGNAAYHRQRLKADNSAFQWSVSGGIGTIDQNGRFTAATPGTGSITAAVGNLSATIPVTVSGTLNLVQLEDFEKGTGTFASNATNAALSVNTAMEQVRYGAQSLRLDYDLSSEVSVQADYRLSQPYNSVNLWVYGDGSGHTLSLRTDSADHDTVVLGTLDFTGWKQLTASLPADTAITGLTLSGAGGSGTIYLDQFVATTNGRTDTTVPTVTASIADGKLTGAVTDETDGILSKDAITVTKDGTAIAFDYNTATGHLSAPLNISDHAGHRFTITAKDASGNIGRASADVAASSGSHQFTDISASWAATYIDWLKTAGITSGYANGTFRPNQNISRQEFAVMLYRYLKLDDSQYGDVVLPFADSGAIGSYAVTAVKALYTKGIINGTTASDGQLYFNPEQSLTRAQAAAMIGRTQAKGYAAGTRSFTDQASIPSYAAAYIRTMSAQGVIGGYTDGSFRPNENITRAQMAKILYNLM